MQERVALASHSFSTGFQVTHKGELILDFALFTGGWIALAILGTSTTLSSQPLIAFVFVAAIGIACSVKGFGGLEMLLAMIIATIVGGLLLPMTNWAWIAPWVPGGFMVSVVLTDRFGKDH